MKRIVNLLKKFLRFDFDYILNAIEWRLPNWLFVYMHTIIVKADKPKVITRKLSSYFQRFATIEDAALIDAAGISKQLLQERLENGDRCYIMGIDDKILTILWASSGKRYLKLGGGILDPGDNGIIVYGGYTEKSARLKGLFPVAFNELYQSYIREGKHIIYAAIHSLNEYSLKLHERMNFTRTGESIHLSIFNIKVTYYKYWPHKTKTLHIFLKTPPENLFWN